MADSFNMFRCVIILIAAVCVIIVISLQAATVHIVREINEDTDSGSSIDVKLPIDKELKLKYPGMFLTSTEAVSLANTWRNLSTALGNYTHRILEPICNEFFCHIILAQYHTCCCNVTTFFNSPNTAKDTNNINRTLSQFNGNRQYFYTENCTQTTPLGSGCRCTQNEVLFTAVYNVYPAQGEYDIAFFRLGTVCKDLNT